MVLNIVLLGMSWAHTVQPDHHGDLRKKRPANQIKSTQLYDKC